MFLNVIFIFIYMNVDKKLILLLLTVVVISLVIFYTNQSKNKKVSIGYSALRISLPVFVAQEKGYFREEGLDVELIRFDTAQPLMNSLVAGNIQIGGYTALPITFNGMIRSNTKLYFISAMIEDQNHRISYLIIPKNSSKNYTIKDLKGKRIGILPTIAYRVWLEQILKTNNIQPDEVKIVPINPALSPSALASNQVDALFTNDPAATTVIQKDIGRLISNEVEVPKYLGEPFIFGSFNIRKDFADSHPEITKKIIRALNKGIKFVNEHPKEAKEIMKKYVHPSQKLYVDFYPDALYLDTYEVNPDDFQNIADKYNTIGIINEHIDVKPLVIVNESWGNE